MLRVFIVGNSFKFSRRLQVLLTNSPSNPAGTSVRIGEQLVELEIVVGGEVAGEAVWALEALRADGMIYAFDSNELGEHYTIQLTTSLHQMFPALPSILVSNDLSTTEPVIGSMKPRRLLEIDVQSGENCHLALLSLVYWMLQYYSDEQ